MPFKVLFSVEDVDDLENGDHLALEWEQDDGDVLPLLFVKDESQTPPWFLIENLCTHGDIVMDDPRIDISTCEMECPLHGARFDLKSGKATRMPAVTGIRTFALRVVQGNVEADLP